MKKSTWNWILVIVVILGAWYLIATNKSEAPSTPPPTDINVNTSPEESNTAPSPLISISTVANLGSYLIASNGMTLYTYSKDTTGVSNCTGACATNWPPYTTSSSDTSMSDSNVSVGLGTIHRTDGSLQLTYKGMPLYFYKGDLSKGDTKGQNVGGVWFVVKP